ncbi:MAG: Lpg1974 family pore-forming outer membrane protein [Chlamydiota bacterium]
MVSKYLVPLIVFSFAWISHLSAEPEVLLADTDPSSWQTCPEPECLPPPPETCEQFPVSRGSLRGGFLYWFAKQNGLAFTNHSQSALTTSDFTRSSLVKPEFEWRPGFELAASYGFNRSFWSLDLSFLYYWGKASGHKSTSGNDGIFPTLSIAPDTLPSDYVTSAKVKWTLSTAILDAAAVYEWKTNSWFTLIPFIALRDVWITEKIRAAYDGATYNAGSDVVRMKSDFYGIGPLVGLTPKFILGEIFSLYGKASVSYLASWFDVTQREVFLSTTRASLKRDVFKGSWNANFAVGLKLTKKFSERSARVKSLELDLGFDYLFFTQAYEFVHGSQFSLPGQGKTLTLYGIHASVGAYF